MKGYRKILKYKYQLTGLLLGTCVIPLGLHKEFIQGFMVGFEILGNLLLGVAALYTAWWARKTFAFKEKIQTYEKTIDVLDMAQQAFMRRFGSEYSLYNSLVSAAASSGRNADHDLQMMSEIEIGHKVAEQELHKLHDSFFVSPRFRVKLLLAVQVTSFEDGSQVQTAFMELKNELRKDYDI
mgnify:CR=1 FL=1